MHRLATFRTRPLKNLLRRHAGVLRLHHPQFATRLSPLFAAPFLAHSSTYAIEHSHTLFVVHSSIVSSLRAYFYGAAIFLSAFASYIYLTDTRSSIHLLTPSILTWLYEDAEDAHEAGNAWLGNLYRFGLHPRERQGSVVGTRNGDEKEGGEIDLSIEVFGHTLDNPIGTSAGIDKHAEIPDPLFALGPAIVELGGVTPDPQDGNPRPRVFRLPSQNGLVNRYGLNSHGSDDMAMRLRNRVRAFAYQLGLGVNDEAEQVVLDGRAGVPGGSLSKGKLLAVQVAKNKVTDEKDVEAVRMDYVYCVERLARYADIIVVNVSSPNTPGLRTLQRSEPLAHILKGVVDAARSTDRATTPAVMVKVSPDEDSEDQIRGIADAVWASGVDGIIVGNTTAKRGHNLIPTHHYLSKKEEAVLSERGGYSGPQLFERTVKLVARYRRILDDDMYFHASTNESSSTPPSSKNPATTSQEDLVHKIRQGDQSPPPPQQQQQQADQPTPTTATDINNKNKSAPALTPPTSIHSPAQTLLPPARKIIFATGGITSGAQALEVLAAGASVAQVYTALVYGGVGTLTRMKGEMRDKIAAAAVKRSEENGAEAGGDRR